MSGLLLLNLLFGRLEADARRGGGVAEIDQLVRFAPVQSTRGFFAKISDWPQVIYGFKKLIHAFASDGKNVIERLTFGIDQCQERRSREIHPNDATVRSRSCPTRATAISGREILRMEESLMNEIGFECFQTFILNGDKR